MVSALNELKSHRDTDLDRLSQFVVDRERVEGLLAQAHVAADSRLAKAATP
jgi:hypothetical protein